MKNRLLVVCIAFLVLQGKAQVGRFEKEIAAFEKQDSASFPKKGQILFTGSSSIRLWDDFDVRYKDYAMVRRGFGGGCLYEIPIYAGRIIFPYKPSKVFLYAGENDIASGIKADSVFKTFQRVFKLLSDSLPAAQLYFISAKPSPSREKYSTEMVKFNQLVARLITKQKKTNWTFIDVYKPMLGSDGKPIPTLFKKDNLHMLSSGYEIWDKELRRYL
jgi:hypothetical protein